jgi:hypothetical protein
VGLNTLKSLNLTNGYPNNNKNKNNKNNNVKSKPLELRSRVKIRHFLAKSFQFCFMVFKIIDIFEVIFLFKTCPLSSYLARIDADGFPKLQPGSR